MYTYSVCIEDVVHVHVMHVLTRNVSDRGKLGEGPVRTEGGALSDSLNSTEIFP